MKKLVLLATLMIGACASDNEQSVREVVFHVEGMYCESCVGAVTNEMNRMDGVQGVQVTLADSTVVFQVREDQEPSQDQIRKAIEDLGYKVHFDLNSP
ncbi:MAG: copper chaperone [Bacteroidetes bacterium HLUCCA01]|nr:MAG: copper chaperone [Bacteroidetes bacterium HLUCCA01]